MKIAIVLPAPFKGGTFRGVSNTAIQLLKEARNLGQNIQIDAWLDARTEYSAEEIQIFIKHKIEIQRYTKEIKVKQKGRCQAHPEEISFIANKDLNNYDFVLFISNAIQFHPNLSVRHGIKIYDFLQRRVPTAYPVSNSIWEQLSRSECIASKMNLIITTTENTFLDAVNYAGFEPSKTKIVSELIDFDWLQDATKLPKNERYIHWATNATPHKNHKRIISALKEVLEIYQDFCVIVTGVETEKFITSSINRNSYTKEISSQIYEAGLEKKIIFKGNLEPSEYKKILINAQLHLQSSLYDNGSFTPLEATKVNVPSVYGRYPQMVELARTHNVNGLAANPYDEKDIKIKILNILGNEYLLKTKQIDQHEILESNKLLLTILESTD